MVDNRAESASLSELRALAVSYLADLQPRATGLMGKTFDIEGRSVHFDEATLLQGCGQVWSGRGARGVHVQHLAQAAGQRPYELEVSVDETEQPTSHSGSTLHRQ